MDMKFHVASFGHIPGTDQMQFMINANFNGGLFEAFTMTVCVPSGYDEHAVQLAVLARAKELAQAFYQQAETTRLLPHVNGQETAA